MRAIPQFAEQHGRFINRNRIRRAGKIAVFAGERDNIGAPLQELAFVLLCEHRRARQKSGDARRIRRNRRRRGGRFRGFRRFGGFGALFFLFFERERAQIAAFHPLFPRIFGERHRAGRVAELILNRREARRNQAVKPLRRRARRNLPAFRAVHAEFRDAAGRVRRAADIHGILRAKLVLAEMLLDARPHVSLAQFVPAEIVGFPAKPPEQAAD